MNINVLGTNYSITEGNEIEYPKLKNCNGYCDNTIKECVIYDCRDNDLMSKDNLEEYKKKVKRHELIHAFLFESGLGENSWANNEEIIDWIAYQFSKLKKAFEDANCL